MNPIVFIDGYASSGSSINSDAPADTLFLDVGEAETTAMIEVRLPPDAGSVPHKQFAHGIILKLLNSDARRQGLADGTIELWDGHSEASLEAELQKSSRADDSIYQHSRAHWLQRKTA